MIIWKICIQVTNLNTNNLHTIIWFQLFLLNTNNFYTVIWFQVLLSNNIWIYQPFRMSQMWHKVNTLSKV